MHCADTSFLLAYYGCDAHTMTARSARTAHSAPLHVHALNDFELANALRALAFRGLINPSQLTLWLADYEMDKRRGVLIHAIPDANAVLRSRNHLCRPHRNLRQPGL